MKYKIIYSENPLYIEVEAKDEQERKDALNGIIFIVKDFYKKMGYPQQEQTAEPVVQVQRPKEEPATESQIKLMLKWKIDFPENCTKRQACYLIHQYKRDHEMPDR